LSGLHLRSATFIAAIFSGYLAVFMTIPAVVDLYVGNRDWQVFAISALIVGGLASAVALATYGTKPPVSVRFGFLLVNMLWVTTALSGAVPLFEASLDLGFTDAVFESVSALTTTGSTVIAGLDQLPPGLLIWRSFLQWIGGIGVIALGLFVLPFLKIGGFSYLRIESSDIEDRPFARLSSYTAALVAIYSLLTLLCAIAYALAGMTPFDALNHALTTLATGGFSTHDSSLGFYADKPAVLWVGTVFMFVAALPFSILILLAVRGRLDPLGDPQIRVFAGYCSAFILAVAIYWTIAANVPFGTALTHSAFNFVSLITTTGYASGDYSNWGPFVIACALIATFLGGCSGSTSGGIKAYRFYLLFEMMGNGLRKIVYPHSVQPMKYGSRTVDLEMQRAVVLFIATFFGLLCIFTLLLSATGLDFVTAFTGSLTALTNVGPGLGEVIGPAGNFATLPDLAKWMLIAAMLLGRLEILAVLVVLSPAFWGR
jgi:trk system potassium uptake protein TrkH